MKQLFSNKWAWLVALLVIINIASLSTVWYMACTKHRTHFKRSGHERNHMGIGRFQDHKRIEFLSEELHLTEEQEKAFEILREQHFKELDSTFDHIQSTRKELLQSLGKSETSVEGLLQKIGTYEADVQRSTFSHFNKMYALCNDEQKKILKDKLVKISSRRTGFIKKRMGKRDVRHHHELPPPQTEEEESNEQ